MFPNSPIKYRLSYYFLRKKQWYFGHPPDNRLHCAEASKDAMTASRFVWASFGDDGRQSRILYWPTLITWFSILKVGQSPLFYNIFWTRFDWCNLSKAIVAPEIVTMNTTLNQIRGQLKCTRRSTFLHLIIPISYRKPNSSKPIYSNPEHYPSTTQRRPRRDLEKITTSSTFSNCRSVLCCRPGKALFPEMSFWAAPSELAHCFLMDQLWTGSTSLANGNGTSFVSGELCNYLQVYSSIVWWKRDSWQDNSTKKCLNALDD